MICYECDICRKAVKEDELETLILYKKSIDYCKNCKDKAESLKKAFLKSANYYNREFYKNLEEAEQNIFLRWKKNLKK